MTKTGRYRLFNFLIAAVWLVNGLLCKLLDLVPRHREIVARILGPEHAAWFTGVIGCLEIGMALWILSGIRSRLNVVTQVTCIAVMNITEFMLAPDLLLWGRMNALFAALFILFIYYNEFCLKNDRPAKERTLKDHPFAVEAFFENTYVFSFAVPKEQLRSYIPACLELDTFRDKWAFVAVAMVQTKHLRPKGFPEKLGNDFFLAGYRVFVRYTDEKGKRLRGLYILKSETDKRKMAFFGNIFTHYNYTTTDIHCSDQNGIVSIRSKKSGFKVEMESPKNEPVPLPAHSPFSDWKEARRFSGPLPFTFTFDSKRNKVLIIEGVRSNWTPTPVKVVSCHFPFLEQTGLTSVQLANAFVIHHIPYYWKKGKIEIWKPKEDLSRVC